MKILVTGGMGEVGRPTVKWLLAQGHTVRVLDLSTTPPIEGAECRQGDVTDFASLAAHMEDIEGVIHLAAYREPSMAPEHELFHVNVDGTFNVFRAAVDAGIRRVVCASSINALGYNFGITFPEGQLRYFPIDEDHPTYTTDPYSFSKRMIEHIGRYFWRREGVTSLFLRFPAVYDTQAGGEPVLLTFVREARQQTRDVMALPEPERSERVRGIIEDFKARARARRWEEAFDFTFPDAYIMFGRSNFWTSLDVRDAARIAEMGLLADYEGSHAVYVTDDENLVGLPSRELVEVWFPDVKIWRRPVEGTESLVSIKRACELVGFEPRFALMVDGDNEDKGGGK
ncbi:MAG: NAD-dependent epimerase/dehydratase family protein [Anaerolineae bacterium]